MDHDAHQYLVDAAGRTTACTDEDQTDPFDDWLIAGKRAAWAVLAIFVMVGYLIF